MSIVRPEHLEGFRFFSVKSAGKETKKTDAAYWSELLGVPVRPNAHGGRLIQVARALAEGRSIMGTVRETGACRETVRKIKRALDRKLGKVA